MKISVFTPTFNSTATLRRAYESLEKQTYKNFEWIIIDDFSSDKGDTKKLIEELASKASFPCKTHFFKENHFGGKSLKKASELATGEIIGTLDHDDQLTPNSLEKVVEYAQQYFIESSIGCIAGRCENQNGAFIGNKFRKNISVHYDGHIRYKEGITSELIVFSKTSVIKEYSKFMKKGFTYGLLWAKISEHYRTVYVNDVFRIYDTGNPTSYTNDNKLNLRFPEEKVEMNMMVFYSYRKYLIYKPLLTFKQMVHTQFLRKKYNVGNQLSKSKLLNTTFNLTYIFGLFKYYLDRLKNRNK